MSKPYLRKVHINDVEYKYDGHTLGNGDFIFWVGKKKISIPVRILIDNPRYVLPSPATAKEIIEDYLNGKLDGKFQIVHHG